jgi:hypothetical protein
MQQGIENRFRENNKDRKCLVMGTTPLYERSFTKLLSNNGGETKEG